jgi:hypothetical protein
VSDPRRPRAETLAWVEQTLGAGARVVRCRRLTGGIASTVHQLDVEQAGRRRSYVLRWWSARENGRPVASERAVLAALEAAACLRRAPSARRTTTRSAGPRSS